MAITRRAAIRGMVGSIAAAPAVLRGRYRLFAQSTTQYSARAIRLMEEATVVDLLNQFMFPHQVASGQPTLRRWLSEPGAFTAADAARFIDSGINVFCLGLGARADNAHEFFAEWNGFSAAYPQWLMRIDDASDFERAKRERKIGIMLTLQDSIHFDRIVGAVDFYYSLGQRISQLTGNYANSLGSGVLENRDGGLTVAGQAIVSRMGQVGMAVDLSHCGDQTTLDVLQAAKVPVLFTHATCRSLIPGHVRAKTDEMLRKMAATGGMMGLAFIRFYLRDREPVNIGHAVDHIDYMRKLVGVEYVGVGSDVDITGWAAARPLKRGNIPAEGPSRQDPNFERLREHRDPTEDFQAGVRGLDHPKRMFDLTDALISRGYSDADIKLILGGNAVRVLGEIWSTRN